MIDESSPCLISKSILIFFPSLLQACGATTPPLNPPCHNMTNPDRHTLERGKKITSKTKMAPRGKCGIHFHLVWSYVAFFPPGIKSSKASDNYCKRDVTHPGTMSDLAETLIAISWYISIRFPSYLNKFQ